MKSQPKKIYVAMSGGVDSSVAAALLKKRGFDVVGVFMKPWQPSFAKASEGRGHFCLWKNDREDAMRVASKLGIPLLTWDFSKEYKKEVTDYMIKEYRSGRTPNPDVMCNKHIKFGLFLEKALKEEADYIATGHYVRIKPRRGSPSRATSFSLYVALDKNKDQSYFLWTLTQKQLKYCLFPIGDYTKLEVRRMAKRFDLPTAKKKDSQGVCFIGPLDMKEFLKKYIKPKSGKILDLDGNLVGFHDGTFYYTIGQRHGLNIRTGGGPYFIVSKNLKKNIIYVGGEKDLMSREAKIGNISWINSGIKLPGKISVRLRYRASLKKAVLGTKGRLKLINPERAITEGQSAVFYRGSEMLGGGTILNS